MIETKNKVNGDNRRQGKKAEFLHFLQAIKRLGSTLGCVN